MVVAVVVVLQFRSKGLEHTRCAYPLLLATFPVYYWIFAVYASDYTALVREFIAGGAFLAIAYAAYRLRSFATLLLLALGYVAHSAYDFYHDAFFVNPGAPTWWPEFCGSVDFLVGCYVAYLALSWHKRPAAT
ncbi:hypothetical protein [Luteimonas vadosa]|uniref:DUF2238 domain-containing protein n=1 Tax=Luteimonas vadosa TaxID=1165507 RepID=A0ABP9E6Q1_9GAMM